MLVKAQWLFDGQVLNGYAGQWPRPYCRVAWPNAYWHLQNKLPEYEAPVFTVQMWNHKRKWQGSASVPKNGYGIGVTEYYVSANYKQ